MLLRKSLLLEPSSADGGGGTINPNDGGTDLVGDLKPLPIPGLVETPAAPIEETSSEEKTLSVEDFGEKPPIIQEVKKEESKKLEPPKPQDKRDYSMFRQEHVEFAKQTPNAVFDFLKTELPKYYELEKKYKDVESRKVPDSWYQHKDAFALTEDYQKIQEDFRYASFEEQHWKKQLAAIKNGATEFLSLEGYDKEGKPQFTKVDVKSETLAEKEIELAQNIAAANSARLGLHKQASDIQGNWSKMVNDTVTNMKQSEAKYYPFYEKPTEAQQKIMNEIGEMIPSIFRNNPLASMLVKSGTLNVELVNKLKAAMTEIARLKGNAAGALKTGPNGSETMPSGGSSGGKILDMADFK